MSATTDWITALSTLGLTVGVGLTAWQLKMTRKQFVADHLRSRRENAIRLYADWAKNLDRRATAARKFAQELGEQENKCIFQSDEFEIDASHAGRLAAALAEKAPEAVDGKIKLTVEHSSEIRWQLVTYLNNLEAVLSAWHHHVADRALIEEQYRFLTADSNYIAEKFRKIAGGAKTYPAIYSFVDYMKKKEHPVSQGPTGF